MLFNSYVFILCFLPATLGGFALSARFGGRTATHLWLILASFVFYGWWNPADVPLLGASVLANNAALRLIAAPSRAPRLRDAALVLAVGANLGLLAYFKYLASLLGGLDPRWASALAPARSSLPLGISFFTFTQIGLLLDARRDPAIRPGLRDHALFVTFFPHLIAGPLLHHREMMPQFAAPLRPSASDIGAGLSIFVLGLAKKALFADRLAPTAVAGYAHPAALGAAGAWAAVLAYSMQLYFDFSGYSDMAIGLARLFGIRFPANFNSPYKARSVIDYWQRWHITLTRYLTWYVFTPTALAIGRWCARRGWRSRGRPSPAAFALRVAMPVGLTMALVGIWHGSGLTFLAFGVLHGAFLTVNHAWRIYRSARPAGGRTGRAWRIALTYSCVLAGSVLFRADSLGGAWTMLTGMAGLRGLGTGIWDATLLRTWMLILGLGAIAFLAPNTQEIMAACGPVLDATAPPRPRWTWGPSLGWAAALGCVGALGLLALGQQAEFLYFQF